MASICDIVLNHTANESEWIYEHPDATYSCHTCPHLRPAFLLDALLAQASDDVAAGKLEHLGVPNVVETEQHLEALKYQLHIDYLQRVKLYEFYQVDAEKYLREFKEEVAKRGPPKNSSNAVGGDRSEEILMIQDAEYRRLGMTIDFEKALDIFNVFR